MALLPTPQDNNHDKYNLYYMVNLGFDLYQKVSKTKKKRQLQSSSRNIFIFLKVIFFLQVI